MIPRVVVDTATVEGPRPKCIEGGIKGKLEARLRSVLDQRRRQTFINGAKSFLLNQRGEGLRYRRVAPGFPLSDEPRAEDVERMRDHGGRAAGRRPADEVPRRLHFRSLERLRQRRKDVAGDHFEDDELRSVEDDGEKLGGDEALP